MSLLFKVWRGVLLLLGLVLATTLHAQTTIKGHVTDTKGTPLPRVVIAVEGTSAVAVTNSGGYYSFQFNPEEKVQLKASLVGFQSETKEIKAPGKELVVDFKLREDFKLLGEVLVVAPSSKEVMQNSSFSATSLDVKPLVGSLSNLNQLVTRSSGVMIREEGGIGSDFDLTITGLSGNAIRYFVNGIPLSSLGSGITLATLPVNLVERVEIYKGVVPPELGLDALGGAVNIITKSNSGSYLDVSAQGGSFSTVAGDVSGQYQHASTGITLKGNLSFKSSKNNYLMHDVEVWNQEAHSYQRGNYRRFHDGYRSLMSQVEFGFAGRSWADEAFLGISYSKSIKEIQTGFSQKLVVGEAFRDRKATRYSLRYSKQRILLDGLSVNLFASHTQDHIIYTDTAYRKYSWDGTYKDAYYNEIMNREGMIRLTERPTNVVRALLAYQFLPSSSISLNYTYSDNKNNRKDLYNKYFEPTEDYLARHTIGFTYGQYLWDNRVNATLFVKDYIFRAILEQTDYYWITGSKDVPRDATKNYVGYGLASRVLLFPELSFKVSYERAVRLPTVREFLGNGASIFPNLKLRPEQAHNINVEGYGTWDFARGHRLTYKGNFFVRDVVDYIRRVVTGDVESKYDNVGKARVLGGEVEVAYKYKRLLDFTVNATYTDERNRATTHPDGRLDATFNNRIPNKPFFYANALTAVTLVEPFSLKRSSLRIDASLAYTHWFYLTWAAFGTPGSKAFVPTQWSTNLGATLSLNQEKYVFSLQCTNLFDNINYDNYLLQKPGRALLGKIKVFIN